MKEQHVKKNLDHLLTLRVPSSLFLKYKSISDSHKKRGKKTSVAKLLRADLEDYERLKDMLARNDMSKILELNEQPIRRFSSIRSNILSDSVVQEYEWLFICGHAMKSFSKGRASVFTASLVSDTVGLLGDLYQVITEYDELRDTYTTYLLDNVVGASEFECTSESLLEAIQEVQDSLKPVLYTNTNAIIIAECVSELLFSDIDTVPRGRLLDIFKKYRKTLIALCCFSIATDTGESGSRKPISQSTGWYTQSWEKEYRSGDYYYTIESSRDEFRSVFVVKNSIGWFEKPMNFSEHEDFCASLINDCNAGEFRGSKFSSVPGKRTFHWSENSWHEMDTELYFEMKGVVESVLTDSEYLEQYERLKLVYGAV